MGIKTLIPLMLLKFSNGSETVCILSYQLLHVKPVLAVNTVIDVFKQQSTPENNIPFLFFSSHFI